MTADEIIAQVKDLPVVSETARKLTTQLNQPELHRDELVKTLTYDSVLTAKVLRTCNSAESGVRQPVTFDRPGPADFRRQCDFPHGQRHRVWGLPGLERPGL